MNDNDKKVTSEKPVSLSPLNFKEALASLLKVKPKEGEDKEQDKKEKPSE